MGTTTVLDPASLSGGHNFRLRNASVSAAPASTSDTAGAVRFADSMPAGTRHDQRVGLYGMTTHRRRLGFGVVLAMAMVQLVATQTPAAAATTQRIAGADRYATAAAVSAASFSPGVAVTYIAVGSDFPDALAGTPAAAHGGGPVLPTQSQAIPQPIIDELERLQPARITVLGGTAAVSSAVEQQLGQYTTGAVTRIAGTNRFDTAVEVSKAVFDAGTSVVHVATGAGFADALAGGPVAGVAGGPILLVSRDEIAESTAAELTRLDPDKIVILGGTGAVSDQVQTRLQSFAPTVTRFSGGDRYLTAVAISQGTFAPGVPSVYLASGIGFADALAGGSPAALAPGPLLLSPRECLPPEVKAEIDRLGPDNIIVLGGTGALSPAVESLSVCQPPPPPRVTFGNGTHRVGADIPAGTYRTRADSAGCYWERLSGFSGTSDDIIANNFSDHNQIVTISSSDAGFRSNDCGVWTNDLSPLDGSATAPFGSGTLTVGDAADIAPGTWSAPGGDSCYWERLSGFSGTFDDLIANDFGSTGPIVTISASDAGFDSTSCGTWTKS